MAIKLSRINTGAPNWGGVANNNWGEIETAINTTEQTLSLQTQMLANLKTGMQFGGYIKYIKPESDSQNTEGSFAVSNSYLDPNDERWKVVETYITIAITEKGITTASINTFYILVNEVKKIDEVSNNSFFSKNWEANIAILHSVDTDGKDTFDTIYLNSYTYQPATTTNNDRNLVFNKTIASTAPNSVVCSFPSGVINNNCICYKLKNNKTITLSSELFTLEDQLFIRTSIVQFAEITWHEKENEIVETYRPFTVDYTITFEKGVGYILSVDDKYVPGNDDYVLIYTLYSEHKKPTEVITGITVTPIDNNNV